MELVVADWLLELLVMDELGAFTVWLVDFSELLATFEFALVELVFVDEVDCTLVGVDVEVCSFAFSLLVEEAAFLLVCWLTFVAEVDVFVGVA